jgi:peptidylprolyl isomerase
VESNLLVTRRNIDRQRHLLVIHARENCVPFLTRATSLEAYMLAVIRQARPFLISCLAAAAATGIAAETPTGGAALQASGSTGDVIAHATGIELGANDVRSLLTSLPATERSAAAGNLPDLEQLVRAELARRAVLAEAKSKGFDRRPETQTQLDRVRDEALVRLWVASQAAVPAGFPSEDEIKAAYEANKAALAPATEYRLAQIFISAPDGVDPAKLAVAIKKAADIGTRIPKDDFSKLAQEQSEHADSASKGGDMGYLPDNRLLPEIAAAARDLKPGAVAGPVKTSQGLHFLKLLDRRVGAVPTLAQAHDGLAAALRARRAQELQQTYLTDLNSKLGITVNQIALAKLQQSLK